MADIELPSLIQQRFLDVLLYNESAVSAICVPLLGLQTVFYLVQSRTDCDASSAIGKLARLDDPYVSKLLIAFAFLILPLELLKEVLELRVLDAMCDVKGDWDFSVGIFLH